jgi:hypothetical protein
MTEQQIEVPAEVEAVAKEAATAVLLKWLGKAFRWLRKRR